MLSECPNGQEDGLVVSVVGTVLGIGALRSIQKKTLSECLFATSLSGCKTLAFRTATRSKSYVSTMLTPLKIECEQEDLGIAFGVFLYIACWQEEQPQQLQIVS